MKTTKLLLCALSVAALLGCIKAGAQSLDAQLVDISPFVPVTGTINDGSFIQEYTSGVMNFTSLDPGFSNFSAFCVEPSQDIAYGDSLVYQVQDIGTLARADEISRLVGGYLASAQTSLDAAAVHWAIWEVVGETNEAFFSPFSGNVRITSPANDDVAVRAGEYLQNMATFTPATLVYLTNPAKQDVVTWNLIPEPSSFLLASFAAFGLLRRRR